MSGTDSKKWACERCTYFNWPSSLKCTLCHTPKPLHLIANQNSTEERDIYKIAPLICADSGSCSTAGSESGSTDRNSRNESTKKWYCHACTYLNWPRATKCTQCLTLRRRSPVEVTKPLYVSVSESGAERCCSNSPNSPERAKEVNNDHNVRVAAAAAKCMKWTCSACTYENWPRSLRCTICKHPRGKPVAFQEGESSRSQRTQNVDERRILNFSPDGNKRGEESNRNAAVITSGRAQRSRPQSLSPRENVEVLSGATAAMPNNYDEGRRLKQLRNRLRDLDWLWLNACIGVVEGDPNPVEAYLASGGSITRQLSADEVTMINRPSAFDVGHTLVHLAIRFQREELLATLLSSDVSSQALKRLPSHISPDTAEELRRLMMSSLRQRKGDFPCYFTTELVTFSLPAEIEELPPNVQENLFDELLDRDVQKELEVESPIINWSLELTDRLGSRLYALWNRTAGDCLLDSVLQATWGVCDSDNNLRRALSDSLHDGAQTFYPRWKEHEAMQNQVLHFTLDESQWEQDWAILLSLASQPGSSLEQLHIFALAHILRRPIIVYGVRLVKSFRGETIGFANFQGVYLPLLWEQSFCWKCPIALAYTRGHFSALIGTEPDSEDILGAGAILENNDDLQVVFLPLMDSDSKLLPVHFLNPTQSNKEESILREWLNCCVTEGGILVAQQKLQKRHAVVAQMVDEWLSRYRHLAHLRQSARSPTQNSSSSSSDGETDDE